MEVIPQLVEDPLFTWADVNVATPEPFKNIVTFWQDAVGSIVSDTEIMDVQVEEFPLESLTVSITLFAPAFAQVNVEGETESKIRGQFSVEPLFTCAGVMAPFPLPSKNTVKF